MFPNAGTIFLSPFTDAAVHAEQAAKGQFWDQRNFFGVDISCLKEHKLQWIRRGYLLWRNLVSSPIILETFDETAQTSHGMPRLWPRWVDRSLKTPSFWEYRLNRRATFRKHFLKLCNR